MTMNPHDDDAALARPMESIKVENIIQTQCYKLAKAIEENKESYKPFIGKY